MRRSRACAARKCRYPTRSISRTPRCRSRRRSWPPPEGSSAMTEFVMPSLGADMEAGTLVAWLKQPGDRVARGDIVAEVDTDKGVIEVEVFSAGVIDRLLVEPGTKVPVGTPLAVIRDEEAQTAPRPRPAPPAAAQPAPPAAAQPAPPAAAQPAPPPPTPRPEPAPSAASLHAPEVHRQAQRLRISPSARRLARELSVDASSAARHGARRSHHARGHPAGGPAARRRTDARRSHSRRRAHAPGDRRRDGAFQARDPALLRQPHHRLRPARWLGSRSTIRAVPSASG